MSQQSVQLTEQPLPQQPVQIIDQQSSATSQQPEMSEQLSEQSSSGILDSQGLIKAPVPAPRRPSSKDPTRILVYTPSGSASQRSSAARSSRRMPAPLSQPLAAAGARRATSLALVTSNSRDSESLMDSTSDLKRKSADQSQKEKREKKKRSNARSKST